MSGMSKLLIKIVGDEVEDVVGALTPGSRLLTSCLPRVNLLID
jgi:hypothetical protein